MDLKGLELVPYSEMTKPIVKQNFDNIMGKARTRQPAKRSEAIFGDSGAKWSKRELKTEGGNESYDGLKLTPRFSEKPKRTAIPVKLNIDSDDIDTINLDTGFTFNKAKTKEPKVAPERRIIRIRKPSNEEGRASNVMNLHLSKVNTLIFKQREYQSTEINIKNRSSYYRGNEYYKKIPLDLLQLRGQKSLLNGDTAICHSSDGREYPQHSLDLSEDIAHPKSYLFEEKRAPFSLIPSVESKRHKPNSSQDIPNTRKKEELFSDRAVVDPRRSFALSKRLKS